MRAHFPLSRVALALACSAAFLHSAHAQVPAPVSAPVDAPAAAASAPAPVVNSELNSALLNHLLQSELEFKNQETASTGFQRMLSAARQLKNEQLFQRATNMAVDLGSAELALVAATAWRTALPQSQTAHRYEFHLLLAAQRTLDTATPMRHMLALSPDDERAAQIASLPRLLRAAREKAQAAKALEQALQPWLEDPITRSAAQVALGQALAHAGQIDRALELARRAHAQAPADEQPVLLALQLLSVSPEAEPLVISHLQAKPQGTAMRLVYAQVLASAHRYPEAIIELETIIRNAPQLAMPWLRLAAMQLEEKQAREAKAVVLQFLERLKDGRIVLAAPSLNGSASEGAADSDEAPSAESSAEAGVTLAHLLLAKAAEQMRDYAGAAAWLDKVTDPRRAVEVATRRAELLAQQGKLQKGLEVIRAAPESGDESARGKLIAEAQLLSDAKQWAEAEAVLSTANQRYPNDADLIYQQAMLAEKLNRLPDMERLLRRVIAISPEHFHAYNALGYTLAERNQRLDEARTLIRKALELAPGEPFITDSLGWVEYRLGNQVEALRLLQQAYHARRDTEIGLHLGELLWVSGQRDDARRVLREVRRRDANSAELKKALARLQVDL